MGPIRKDKKISKKTEPKTKRKEVEKKEVEKKEKKPIGTGTLQIEESIGEKRSEEIITEQFVVTNLKPEIKTLTPVFQHKLVANFINYRVKKFIEDMENSLALIEYKGKIKIDIIYGPQNELLLLENDVTDTEKMDS